MAIKFPTGVNAKLASASWMDAQSKISIYCRVRLDTIVAATSQYIYQYRNAGGTGDQIGLRKDGTSPAEAFKVSVTAGGANVTAQFSTPVVDDEVNDTLVTWQKNLTDGLLFYTQGVERDSPNTTSQTGDLNASVGDLRIASRDGGFNSGVCTIEGLGIWLGHIVTPAQYDALRKGAWPHMIGMPRPALWMPMWPGLVTRIPDLSSNNRHIEAAGITGTPVSAPLLGQWMPPSRGGGSAGKGVASAPPPNPYTLLATLVEPSPGVPPPATYTAPGLTNGTTYQFYVTALDDSNESGPSNVVEATPAAPAPPASTTPIPWRRQRRYSKFRPSQQ